MRSESEWNVGDVVLGVYEVKALLGEGGMGRVYRVRHRGWGVDLAVKSPRPEALTLAGGAESFAREAETWVGLGTSPHLVTCHYVRTIDGVPRIFLELVDGGSLADNIAARRSVPSRPRDRLAWTLDIAIQFAWGIAAAHDRDLVHQDIKPGNVMLTSSGVAKAVSYTHLTLPTSDLV